jgi:predicted amidophosphoribosyltransferase
VEVISLCTPCQQQKYSFEAARSFGQYQGGLARAIVLLKFERIEPLGEWFAEELEKVVRANSDCLRADVIVPDRCTGNDVRLPNDSGYLFGPSC